MVLVEAGGQAGGKERGGRWSKRVERNAQKKKVQVEYTESIPGEGYIA